MVSDIIYIQGAPWPGMFVTSWPMSFKDLFRIFSGSVRDLELEADVEAEAVHEILTVFRLLFLRGRARRGEALE